jgi:DNA-binding GntR family transcriptional regulator
MDTLAPQIDRGSFEPAYMQLVRILREQISEGQFRPGDRLPSESQLCKSFQVSPMTVRRAINVLLEQGVVSTAQGRGTFVKPLQLGAVTFGLEQLQTLFTEAGTTTVKMLEASIVKADSAISEKLGVSVGDRIIHIRRLFSKNHEPRIYHVEYMIYDPKRPVVEAEMEVTSLYGLFSGAGTSDIKWGQMSISAGVLSGVEASVLEAAEGSPAFYLEHTFYDYDNHPMSWGGFYCRGDRFQFTTTVGVLEGPAIQEISKGVV